MNKVKTAISIDISLLEETMAIAQEMDDPKSQVVSLALEEYVRLYRNRQVLQQINEAYAEEADKDEAGALEIIDSYRRKSRNLDEWK